MIRRDTETDRVGMQASAGRLRGSTKLPPTRVGLCTTLQPGTRGGLSACVEVTPGVVPTIHIPWSDGAHAQLENNRIYGQACRACDNGSNPDSTGKLDYAVHGHRAPRRSLIDPSRFMLWVTHTTPNQRQGGDTPPEGPEGKICFIHFSGETFTNRNPPPPLREEERGVALLCAVHRKWNGYKGPGMEGCHITLIRHQTSRPVLPLK